MTELKHEIEIKSSPEKVLSILTNLESVQHYNPGVKSAKYVTDKKVGTGSARECDLGKDGIVRERVTEYIEGKSITMELYEHNWPLKFMKWTTTVTPTSTGCRVSQILTYEMKLGLLGLILNKLIMKRKFDSVLNDLFKSMKSYIERQ